MQRGRSKVTEGLFDYEGYDVMREVARRLIGWHLAQVTDADSEAARMSEVFRVRQIIFSVNPNDQAQQRSATDQLRTELRHLRENAALEQDLGRVRNENATLRQSLQEALDVLVDRNAAASVRITRAHKILSLADDSTASELD
jgi:hypothetical protein